MRCPLSDFFFDSLFEQRLGNSIKSIPFQFFLSNGDEVACKYRRLGLHNRSADLRAAVLWVQRCHLTRPLFQYATECCSSPKVVASMVARLSHAIIGRIDSNQMAIVDILLFSTMTGDTAKGFLLRMRVEALNPCHLQCCKRGLKVYRQFLYCRPARLLCVNLESYLDAVWLKIYGHWEIPFRCACQINCILLSHHTVSVFCGIEGANI